mgnify:CR=1 FL=1
MDDLRNVVKPKPIERFAMDVNGSVAEIVESMRAEGERNGVADRRALRRRAAGHRRRSLRARPRLPQPRSPTRFRRPQPGGRVTIATARAGDQVEISVSRHRHRASRRSGCAAIFDDFVTTKRRGLGLGLAISKRIVEQLDGTITVESEVGRGTAFTLRFPARDDLSAQAAAS